MKTKIFCAGLICLLMLSFSAYAYDGIEMSKPAENPVLSGISFKNAKIDGTFSPFVNEYSLTLDDPLRSPTLEDYTIEGDAQLFINYILDDANHQKGISATLEYESGSTIYSFLYSNAQPYKISGNNYLKELHCRLGELQPALNEEELDYKLYIPSDLTVLNLMAVTEEVGSYCNAPSEIAVSPEQEPTIPITVTASNGEARTYNFKIKRLNRNCEEVEALMQKDDFKTLIESERFYKKPGFIIALLSAAGGFVIISAFAGIAKKASVKAEDEEEEEFFV